MQELIKLKDLLPLLEGENGDFYVNITEDSSGKRVYFGYSRNIPMDVTGRYVGKVYIDWSDEALGITVK